MLFIINISYKGDFFTVIYTGYKRKIYIDTKRREVSDVIKS